MTARRFPVRINTQLNMREGSIFLPRFRAKISKGSVPMILRLRCGIFPRRAQGSRRNARAFPAGGESAHPLEKEATALPSQNFRASVSSVQMTCIGCVRGCLSCLWVRGAALFGYKKSNKKLVCGLSKNIFHFCCNGCIIIKIFYN